MSQYFNSNHQTTVVSSISVVIDVETGGGSLNIYSFINGTPRLLKTISGKNDLLGFDTPGVPLLFEVDGTVEYEIY